MPEREAVTVPALFANTRVPCRLSVFSHSIEVPAKLVGVRETEKMRGDEENNGVILMEAAREEAPALQEVIRGKGVFGEVEKSFRVTEHAIGVLHAGLVTPIGVRLIDTLVSELRSKLRRTCPGAPILDRPKVKTPLTLDEPLNDAGMLRV